MEYIILNPRDIFVLYEYEDRKTSFDVLSSLDEIENLEGCSGGKDCLENIPNIPGVYFICTKNQILYVGWSKYMRNRLSKNHHQRRYIECPSVELYWTECVYPELEYALIRKLKPVLNRVLYNEK